ncbi:metallophosphoesterase family protein [Maledivibacter halophilus]|uniref:DNA repair exonuclease SbcCD nuclease subunit n=1 Tax=Maledivibacter halophilus TaxID=36842 RepID=A0A1T5IQB5_9FIRM|nr:DNA repair exonuclease [Maledivibacter halophilus]SKC41346.1 DNA repair exonuclease SbcCD nuclease subunit [Maledivibacter halophilus]
MLKFLHIADVHLDTSFYAKNEVLRIKLRDGIRNAFSNAVDLCINEKVNALLIAGDLFDNDKLSFRTEQFLINEFNRLKENGIRVFYATGNHDPGDLSYRANSIKWPDNVYIFKEDKIEIIEVKNYDNNLEYKIISCGHKTNNEGRNLVKKFPYKEGEIPHIGLLHTMVNNSKEAEKHGKYLPCSKEDLKAKGYDYWALGHIHKAQKVCEEKNIYYPGNIQGRNPREIGKKGGILVTIDQNNSIATEFKALSMIQWYTLNIQGIENIKNYSELKEYIINKIENFIEKNRLINRKLILRIELEGRAYLKSELEVKENIEEIALELALNLDLMDLEIKSDNLLSNLDIEEYREGDHVLSLVLELLENLEKNEELLNRLIDTHLIKKGIRRKEKKTNYIKQLLSGLDEAAVSYMIGDKYED